MCGRYAFLLPDQAWSGLFRVLNDFTSPPRYNVAPTQPVPVVVEREGRRTAELFRWGFVPGWVKDPRDFPLLINARAETMAEKPAFRDALRNTRCVVPASGYYEWMKGPGGSRTPYYITSAETETMAFAGLWSTWAGPNGEEVDTMCIVTVEPNLEISGVYDRMPAILRGEAMWEDWLNTRDVDVKDALKLAVTPPPETMRYHRVGRAIGRAAAEGPELIEPANDDEPEQTPSKAGKKPPSAQLDLF